MIRKINIICLVLVLSGLNVFPTSAGVSATKSFKMSLTLPSSVNMPPQVAIAEATSIIKLAPRLNIEETVIVRNNQKVLLRTIVVQ